MAKITRILAANICRLDACIMQIMLPQAMVVNEVSWHLTWVLPSVETEKACV